MPEANPDAWVFFDGEFRRYRDVTFGLMTHALHYGTGCFEGIRGYWSDADEQLNLFEPWAHYRRMHGSARILMLTLPHTVDELVDITAELVKRNEYREGCYVRPILFKSHEGFAIPFGDLRESFGVFTTPMGRYLDAARGIRCKVSTWRRIPDAAMPVRAKVTGAYINSVLAKSEAVGVGFDEAITLDGDGHVAEGSTENLFMVRDGKLVTPPVTSDILEGITRRVVMELAADTVDLQVVERVIDRTELYVADEILLCGTGAEIAPVIDVDGRVIGNGQVGPVATALRERYRAVVHGEDAAYKDRLLPVW